VASGKTTKAGPRYAMRRKRVPQRSCVACRQVRSKRELIRVVRSPDGSVYVDETGKAHGRGAYLCRDRACWERAIGKGRHTSNVPLAHSLKVALTERVRADLYDYAQQLPDTALTGTVHQES
jgi:predicted RNA-binding protein YlxR (DUF448 family)